MRVEPRAQVCRRSGAWSQTEQPGPGGGEHATLRVRQLKRSGRGSAATALSVLLIPILLRSTVPAQVRRCLGKKDFPLVSVDRGTRLEACGRSLEAGAKNV